MIRQDRLPQLCPIIPTTSRNHVIDGSERDALMIKMSMAHGELPFIEDAGAVLDGLHHLARFNHREPTGIKKGVDPKMVSV